MSANRPIAHLVYEQARPGEERMLEDFALQSNGYYKYRSVGEEEARKVFAISPEDLTKGVFLVAKTVNETVGFLGILQVEKEGQITRELNALFVHPTHIGQGFGKLLFKRAMDEARKLGWSEIEWESDPFAADFYRKMGAVEIPEKARTCPLNPK
jgi:GNAT superfamily N-acetyltransferase